MAKAKEVMVVEKKTRAKSRRRWLRGESRKIPLAVILGLWPGISFALASPEHSARQMVERITWTYTGFVPWEWPIRWDGGGLKYGLMPLLGGIFAHFLANATGLNRAIRRIPLIQI